MLRFLDIIISSIILIVFLPIGVFISIIIVFESKGNIIYKQNRVGKNNKDFILLKFRSMKTESDTDMLLTVGENDNRITKFGKFIRKYKLDEFPQLINVIKGDMSIVGPRPEVRKYVNLYTEEQLKILLVRPGITDYASIKYSNENVILSKSNNPENTYIEEIMPSKLDLNIKFINNQNLKQYFKIIFLTFLKIIK